MTPVLVLAYDGRMDAAAIRTLARDECADVVAVTVDIGQSGSIHAVRERALADGAVRAHVFDALDDFVRGCVLPALRHPRSAAWLTGDATLAYPVIASRLVQVARIEGATVVAHGGGEALTAAIRRLEPSIRVVTTGPSSHDVRRLSSAARHLLQRPVAAPAASRGLAARVEIQFDQAVPVSINGVPLPLPELLESLSVIAGQHGIGHAEAARAPGALVLETAYRALDQQSGTVRIELLEGRHRVLAAVEPDPSLVNLA